MRSKKKQHRKQKHRTPSKASYNKPKEKTTVFSNDVNMYLFTLLLAVIYFAYSNVSDGMYQDDEAGHFISMKNFWYDPSSILGNWPKTGYKLVYAIPSLFGETFVKVVNCLVAAFTSFFCYKIVKQLNGKFAILAFVLLASQPMWVQLSFRNYSEIISAFLLVLALYMHFKNKSVWAVLLLSYVCLIRQEFYILLAAYGVYLLFNKQFRAILIGSIPPVFYNIWGGIATGDYLYLIHQIFETSSTYGDAYPRQGIDHYPLVSEIIYGVTVLTLLITYIASKVITWKKINLYIFLPAAIFYLLHCLFNSKSLNFGPSNAGNHRYLIVIAPLLAVMGALALDEIKKMPKRNLLLIFLIPFLFIIGYFWSYEPKGIHIGDIRNWVPLVIGSFSTLFILLPIKNNTIITVVFMFLSVISVSKSIKPIRKTPENVTIEKVVTWYERQVKSNNKTQYEIDENTQVFSQHALFLYYQGKTKYDFNKVLLPVKHEYVDTADVGSLIIWDSHYSYRPKLRETSIPDQYFLNRPLEYRLINQFLSTDRRFNVKAFLKVSESDKQFEEGLAKFNSKKYDEAIFYFNASINKNPQNYVSYFYLGSCYQIQKNYDRALTYYNKSIEINNSFPKVSLYRGNLYSITNRNDLALNDLNTYVMLKPEDANGYMNRGSIFFNLKKYENAFNDYSLVVRLAPYYAQGYYKAGLSQIKLNQKQNACSNFESAKKLGYKLAENAIKQYCN